MEKINNMVQVFSFIPGFHFQLHRKKSNSTSSYETHKSSKLKSYILLIDTLRRILSYKLHCDTIPKSMRAIRYTFYRGGKADYIFCAVNRVWKTMSKKSLITDYQNPVILRLTKRRVCHIRSI